MARKLLNERECLTGLVKMAQAQPENEELLCSTISFISGLVYDQEERAKVIRDTGVAFGCPRPLDISAPRTVDKGFFDDWMRSQGGFKK